jgi:hypothetical protein
VVRTDEVLQFNEDVLAWGLEVLVEDNLALARRLYKESGKLSSFLGLEA